MPERTDISVSRRAFLKLNARADPETLRPPGTNAALLSEYCKGCAACVEACPQQIIVAGEGNFPVLDFAKGACTFCSACVDACPSGAFSKDVYSDWSFKAVITDTCLSLQGISCRACEDACEPSAIRFRLALGGISEPLIDPHQCTGCGACAYHCPAAAVTFKKTEPRKKEDPA